jgi:hypothetical protein
LVPASLCAEAVKRQRAACAARCLSARPTVVPYRRVHDTVPCTAGFSA